ncbi:MAG: hypothetical protein KIT48_01405 [Pseudolabrys sp.]|nr:hypothetical protein [Pseudolabrys sp.]
MPATVTVRETALGTAIADVTLNPRPFVIINRERHSEVLPQIPREFLVALPPGFPGDLLVAPTTLVELAQADLPVGRHREQFLAGDPVMVAVKTLHEIMERPHGGQSVLGLEKRARDGLYVTVALATERLRACADRRAHKKRSTEVQRGEIFARFETLLPDGLSPINLFREGQALLVDWFPGQTGHQVLRAAYTSIADMAGARRGQVDFDAIDREQMELVAAAGAVYAKTLAFVNAQHEMSELIRELIETPEFRNASAMEKHELQAAVLREKGPALHQELAHNKQGGPTPVQLLRAAAAMDFNPAWVFLNDDIYMQTFGCAMRLGRAERGIGAMLEPAQIDGLKHCLALGDEAGATDGQISPWGDMAKGLRDLALKVRPRAGWDEFFAVAAANPGSLWITKSNR